LLGATRPTVTMSGFARGSRNGSGSLGTSSSSGTTIVSSIPTWRRSTALNDESAIDRSNFPFSRCSAARPSSQSVAMPGLKSRSSEPGVMLWYQSTRFADARSVASTAALHIE
jgi:hypothetical protein